MTLEPDHKPLTILKHVFSEEGNKEKQTNPSCLLNSGCVTPLLEMTMVKLPDSLFSHGSSNGCLGRIGTK